MPGRLQDRIAIITGSSSGIGRATAFAMAEEGAKIVCADLREEGLTVTSVDPIRTESDIPTHEQIKANGGEAIFIKVDVTDHKSVEHLVQAAVKQWGRLDIMINNAGVSLEVKNPAPVWEMPLDTWQKTIDINLNGLFYCVKYAAAQMIGQEPLPNGDRGWIVNACSTGGLKGAKAFSAYATSKGAVANLTRCAALDCAPYRVHVNAVCPGFVTSPLTDHLCADAEIRRMAANNHPFMGIGRPEDVAKAYVFLSSDEAQWITGINMPVDGGFLAQGYFN